MLEPFRSLEFSKEDAVLADGALWDDLGQPKVGLNSLDHAGSAVLAVKKGSDGLLSRGRRH